MTYRELFESDLRERIMAGGNVELMVRLVNAYQGSELRTRRDEFATWLGTSRFECSRCRSGFAADDTAHEEDDVLCTWCSHGYLNPRAEVMPGWQRTWSR